MKLAQTVSVAVAMAAFAGGAAMAQTTTGSGANGVTSGPASPSHQSTTLGAGGQTPATPHQADTVRNRDAQPGNSGLSNGAVLGKPAGQR